MLPMPGPPRTTLTMTPGSSSATRYEMPSCLRLMPGPLEDVIARAPAAAAPSTMLMAAISLSDWMNTPPAAGRRRAMYSVISFCGVMG